MRREFLQLAHTYNPDKDNVAGFYISEKLDGGRCFWDGGVSRGVATSSVPWAGVIDPKTGERKTRIKAEATGLWSRYGNPIAAPDWFLNQLPACPLDGELWAGRGNFQTCMSAIRKDAPVDAEWREIKYVVYSSPGMGSLFASGEVRNNNMRCEINREECLQWCLSRRDYVPDMQFASGSSCTFEEELAFLNAMIDSEHDHVYLHRQVKLNDDPKYVPIQVEDLLASVLDKGGEGVIIRDPASSWIPKRHRGLLKYKPYLDDEATVVGFVAGEEGKTGNLLGRIGSLVVRWNDKEFKLAGLTFVERELKGDSHKWALANPGKECRGHFSGNHFYPGRAVTFKYRELTDDGVPKEARYFRIRATE